MTEEMEIQIVSGAALRKQSRHVVTVPATGNSYLMRRPSLADMVKTGLMPDRLIEQVTKVIADGEQANAAAQPQEKGSRAEMVLTVEEGARAQLTAAMLKPRIVDEAKEGGEVEFQDIPQDDRNYLFEWCQGRRDTTPVENSEGKDLTAGEVRKFPDGEEGRDPSGFGSDVQTLSSEGQ